jgi:hypothetical protein
MWDLINCYLSGRHDYAMWCGSGQMFLRCVHCGKRSAGWAVDAKFQTPPARATAAVATRGPSARVIPFDRAAAS